MESLAAVSLAGTILQFVEFAKKLASGTMENHRSISGSTSEHLEAESIARRLRAFARQMIPQETHESLKSTNDDVELQAMSMQCVEISEEVLTALEGLKMQPGDGLLESFYKALKGEWEKDDLQSLQSRLDRLSHSLASTIIPHQVNKLQYQLGIMVQQNERLAARRESDIRKLKSELSEEVLNALQKEGDRVNAGLFLSGAVKQGTRYSAEQIILGLLRFQTMDERHDSIQTAHKKTYEWIFQSKDYLLWLSGDSSLYWISGKPGSGKSTLMKHIFHHPETRNRLEEWSNGQEVITAQFYLWSASRTSLMKSQEGLLRSILFQILREAPRLISSAFPEQWDALTQGLTFRFDHAQDILSISELMKAFKRVSTQMREIKLKFCFFLDGLDEYDGRPSEIIKMVRLLCLPSVKLCVSSRPWNEFEDAFGRQISTKLYMQHLNHRDIESYVIGSFADNGEFQELVLAEGQSTANELVRYIVKAADGVFLWVYLVVQSLLEGLSNADKLTTLRKRLYSLPTDLDEYFERILFTVDEFYETQTPTVFLICLAAADTLPLMIYWFIDCLRDDMEYALNLKVEPITPQQMFGRHKAMKKRLMACSKGLLEDRFVHTGKNDSLSSSVLFNTRVDYLHRTVRDFLRVPERQQRLWDRASVTFNAELNICLALLGFMKILPQEKDVFTQDGPVSHLLGTLFRHIRCFEESSIAPQVEVNFMGRMDQTIQEHAEVLGNEVMNSLPWIQIRPEIPTILLGSVEVGQLRYIGDYLDSSQPSPQLSASLLCHSLLPKWAQSTHRAHEAQVVVEFLLKRGIGPSLALESGKTVWETFLDGLALDTSNLDSAGQIELFEQLKVLLDGGADFEIVRQTRIPGNTESAQRIIGRRLDQGHVAELVKFWEAKKNQGEKPSRLSHLFQNMHLLHRSRAKATAFKVGIKDRFGK